MGFENDKLGRKYYADILTEIVEKPEKYKRNSDSASFTMAIDSSWGTGKTEFLKMWEEELKEKKDEKGNNEYIVIKYNSWENDFAEEPLQSIIYTILSDETFDKQNDKANGKEALKEAFETVIDVAEKAKIPGIKIIAAGAKGIKEVAKTMLQETSMEDKLQEFKNYKSKIETIKEKLENMTKDTKIILLIDELDRCKPLFAIKLLETIKHIFNVKNMSFVFALDMTQLSYSVEKVYGNKIDAPGYICRFFDYITKMPNPDTKKYIEYLMEKRPLIRKEYGIIEKRDFYGNAFRKEYGFIAKRDFYGNVVRNEEMTFINMLQECVQNYQLSLRDINTIYSNFVILEERELKDIDNGKAYALYLLLLILKYKNLDLFNKIFIKHNFITKEEIFLEKMKRSEYFNIEAMEEIKDNVKIQDIKFLTKRGESNILSVDIQNKQYMYSRDDWEYKDKYNAKTELNPYFFYSDIENFENIKEMGIADYIHQKLELFDFEWLKEERQE